MSCETAVPYGGTLQDEIVKKNMLCDINFINTHILFPSLSPPFKIKPLHFFHTDIC